MPLRRAVEMLEISVSGYYHWLKADNEHRNGVAYTDAQIITAVREEIKLANDYVSGAKFFYFRLKQCGLKVAFKRLVKLMRSNGIYHRYHRKYVTTTKSSYRLPHSDNLIKRDFNSFGIDEAWCADITYIPTDEGWLYLASVIDLKSRCLIGYSFDANMITDLISDALLKAIKELNPKYGAIFHSDQGSQYCSHKYQELLTSLGLRSSMSDRGECWGNAVAESFWATVKRENLPISGSFSSRALAKKSYWEVDFIL